MESKLELPDKKATTVNMHSVNTAKMHLNPLYHTLTVLTKPVKEKQSDVVKDLVITHKSTPEPVYYIALAKPPNVLYNSLFQYNDCHLTINQRYKKHHIGEHNALGTIHYTETYENKEAKDVMVVHVYFTNQGLFQSIQAKLHIHGDNEKTIENKELTPQQIELLQNNLKQPMDLVGQLREENYILYNAAVAEATLIDNQLQAMSIDYRKTVAENYIQKARQFINTINEINYCSYGAKDKRGQWMESLLKNLDGSKEPKRDEPSAETTFPVPNTTQSIAPKSPTEIAIPQKTKREEIALKAYQRIESLVESVTELELQLNKHPHQVSLLKNHFQQIQQLNTQLLLFWDIHSHITEKQRTHLNDWASTIKPNSQDRLLESFFKHFWDGNLQDVNELYPLIAHLISQDKIKDILTKLIDFTPCDVDHERKVKQVFDFFYTKSSRYQLVMNSNRVYILDPRGCSFLFKAFEANNLFAYQIILEHGVHPNSVGLLYDGWQIPNIVMLACHRVKHDSIEFLKLALKHGADCNTKSGLAIIDTKKTDEKSRRFFSGRQRIEVLSPSDFHKRRSNTFIENCYKNECYTNLILFIDQMRLDDMLTLLGLIVGNTDGIYKRNIIPGIKNDCAVVMNFQDLDKMHHAFNDHRRQSSLYMALIYGKMTENKECLILAKHLLTRTRAVIRALAEESPQELRNLQNSVLEATKNINSSKFTENYRFERCAFLFLLDPKPTAKTYEALMELCYRQGNYATKSPLKNHDQIFYGIAIFIAKHTCFSKELMKTSIYLDVVAKIQLPDSHPSFKKLS